MKKLLLSVFLMASLFSCSSPDPYTNGCADTIYSLSWSSGTDNVKHYFITHGPSQSEVTSIEINKATYDYYSNLDGFSSGKTCFEGLKE